MSVHSVVYCHNDHDFDLWEWGLIASVRNSTFFQVLVADSKSMFPYICLSSKELKKYGVTILVRVCDATYDKAPVEKEGIHVLVSV